MQKITPFLWFDEQAEEAVDFYTATFKNSKRGTVTRYGDEVPGPKGKVLTATFRLAGLDFMALNGGPDFQFTPATSFFVQCETEDEIDAAWEKLSDGGMALMELGPYPFSKKFGWVADRFGVSWQLNLTGVQQKIDPFLTFVGKQYGRAREAIDYYCSIFENSKIEQIELSDESGPIRAVKHARFTLAGQEFMAMESNLEHNFSFNPAISFYVNCETQAEVDEFWEKLSEGGEKGQCGWLEDKFGVSWQIVPTVLGELMNDPDPEKVKRVVQAMLQMQKLDIAGLQRAYEPVQ